MKRLAWVGLLILLFTSLSGQTQTLPDLRITGESSLKAHLYKRSLLFSPLFDLSDSLPAFIPSGIPNEDPKPPRIQRKHKSYLQLEGNTGLGLNGFFSFYPSHTAFNGVSHQLHLAIPDENRNSFRNELFLGIEPLSDLPLAFRAAYHSGKANNFESGNLDVSLSHYRRSLPLGKSSLNDLNLQLGFNGLKQTNASKSYKRSYYDYYFATRMESGWLDTRLKILGQAGESAMQIAPSLNWEPGGIENLRVHILADAYNFVPSLEFQYRDPLSGGGVFYLSNLPKIDRNTFSVLLEDNPWQAFSDKHKLQKTPLNLNTGFEFVFPRKSDFSLSRLSISNITRYDINTPIPISGLNFGIQEMITTDLFSNYLETKGLFRMEGFLLHQSLGIDLSYLSKDSFKRAPYHPTVTLDSRISYPYKKWLFSTNISQNYFSRDHRGADLPELILINVAAEYHRENSAIYGLVDNLLNQDKLVFSELPSTGITLYLGMKHRF